MSIFVDEIKIIEHKHIGIITRVKIKLITACEIMYIRQISFYLGLKINKNCEKMILKLFEPASI